MSRLSNPEIHDINQQLQTLRGQLIYEEQKLPSQQIYDSAKLQIDIDTLEAKMAAHRAFLDEEKAEKKKKVAASKKVLETTLKDLEKVKVKLDKVWGDILPQHRGRVFEIHTDLRRMIRKS